MKFLAIVIPPYIYHGCSTRKTFWEEKLAGEKKELFEPVSMKNCGKRASSIHCGRRDRVLFRTARRNHYPAA